MASLFPELRHVVVASTMIASFSGLLQAQTVANTPSIDFVTNASTQSDSLGIRPVHLWSFDYVKLLWSDTGAVLTAPAHWNEMDLMYASLFQGGGLTIRVRWYHTSFNNKVSDGAQHQ